jgi:hypothetical protein
LKWPVNGFLSKGPIIAPYDASLNKYFKTSSNARAPL